MNFIVTVSKKDTETIDYEDFKKKVEEIKPKLVVAGAK